MKQKGQAIIVLLLIILVSLTLGLAVVQNSLTDISTSTKTDQASKAFSAAEAALESALLTKTSKTLTFDNNSTGKVDVVPDLPKPGNALEYPQLSKADFAQVWLQDPTGLPPYPSNKFTVYFGNCNDAFCGAPIADEKPAIEVDTVIFTSSNSIYSVDKQYFDSQDPTSRADSNSFTYNASNCNSSPTGKLVLTNASTTTQSKFYCKVNVTVPLPATGTLILTRVRLLYTSITPQKIAVGPDVGSNLPKQALTYTATGTSGNSIRQIQIFRELKVVPYFFDFAIFSRASLTK